MFKGKFDLDWTDLLQAKAPPLIGVDISSSAVKMVELAEAGKNRYSVERYAVEKVLLQLPFFAVIVPVVCGEREKNPNSNYRRFKHCTTDCVCFRKKH